MSHTLDIQTLKSMKSPCCSSTIPYFLSHFSVHHRASRKLYLFKKCISIGISLTHLGTFQFHFPILIELSCFKKKVCDYYKPDRTEARILQTGLFRRMWFLVPVLDFRLYHHCYCHTATGIGFDMNSLWPGDSTGAETGSEFRTQVWNGEKKSPLTDKTVL